MDEVHLNALVFKENQNAAVSHKYTGPHSQPNLSRTKRPPAIEVTLARSPITLLLLPVLTVVVVTELALVALAAMVAPLVVLYTFM